MAASLSLATLWGADVSSYHQLRYSRVHTMIAQLWKALVRKPVFVPSLAVVVRAFHTMIGDFNIVMHISS